jgi:hypothetical protein
VRIFSVPKLIVDSEMAKIREQASCRDRHTGVGEPPARGLLLQISRGMRELLADRPVEERLLGQELLQARVRLLEILQALGRVEKEPPVVLAQR